MNERIEAMAKRRYEAYRFNMDQRVPMWENTAPETRDEFLANAEADAEAFLAAGPPLYELDPTTPPPAWAEWAEQGPLEWKMFAEDMDPLEVDSE